MAGASIFEMNYVLSFFSVMISTTRDKQEIFQILRHSPVGDEGMEQILAFDLSKSGGGPGWDCCRWIACFGSQVLELNKEFGELTS
jgi:hypothetical protein